jgi:signal transduction histidine kinase
MATSANSSYYMRAAFQAFGPDTVSVLLFTDVSAAMAFTTSMNRILGILLAASGLLSLAISIAMSARFRRAIVRLCRHADTIGRGHFTQTAGVFKDTEFNRLSKSMDNMADMLQTYESNQKQFFQNASHEMRTPLMSIQGYAEGILSDVFDKDEAAGVILSEGQKMTDLVSELLYVSRMDSESIGEMAIETLDVKALLYECGERVKPIAHKEDKQVVIQAGAQDIFVAADEEKLERAVLNVLSNAIRYAESTVTVNCLVAEDKVEIVVADDGAGIAAEDLPHIFERFYKGENGNVGLGLAISKDIVKGLGGSMKAENGADGGAVFTVSLPVVGD